MGVGLIGVVSSGGSLPVGASAKVLDVNVKGFKKLNQSISPGTYLIKTDSWYTSAPVEIFDNLGNRYTIKGEQLVTFRTGVTSLNFYAGKTEPLRVTTESPWGRRFQGLDGNASVSQWESTTVDGVKKSYGVYYGTIATYTNNTGYSVAVVSLDGETWQSADAEGDNTTIPEGATIDVDKQGNNVEVRYSSGNPVYAMYTDITNFQQNDVYAAQTNTHPRFAMVTKSMFPSTAAIFATTSSGVWYGDSVGSSYSGLLSNTSTMYNAKRSANTVVYVGSNGYVTSTTNGSSWNTVQTSGSNMRMLDFNGTMWMFSDNSNRTYWTSTDLNTFTQRSMPETSRTMAAALFWSKEEQLWYRLNSYEGFTSSDGINWTIMPREEFLTWTTKTKGRPLGVATSANSYGYVIDTSNVTNFTEVFLSAKAAVQNDGTYRKAAGFTVGIYQLESAAV